MRPQHIYWLFAAPLHQRDFSLLWLVIGIELQLLSNLADETSSLAWNLETSDPSIHIGHRPTARATSEIAIAGTVVFYFFTFRWCHDCLVKKIR
jgi:hypothetical protein